MRLTVQGLPLPTPRSEETLEDYVARLTPTQELGFRLHAKEAGVDSETLFQAMA